MALPSDHTHSISTSKIPPGRTSKGIDLHRAAKQLRRALKAGDPSAIARVRAVFHDTATLPSALIASKTNIKRCQHVVAQEAGHTNYVAASATSSSIDLDQIGGTVLLAGPRPRAFARSLSNPTELFMVPNAFPGIVVLAGDQRQRTSTLGHLLSHVEEPTLLYQCDPADDFRNEAARPRRDRGPYQLSPTAKLLVNDMLTKTDGVVILTTPSSLDDPHADALIGPRRLVLAIDPLTLTADDWVALLFPSTNPDNHSIAQFRTHLAHLKRMQSMPTDGDATHFHRSGFLGEVEKTLASLVVDEEDEEELELARLNFSSHAWLFPGTGPYLHELVLPGMVLLTDLVGPEITESLFLPAQVALLVLSVLSRSHLLGAHQVTVHRRMIIDRGPAAGGIDWLEEMDASRVTTLRRLRHHNTALFISASSAAHIPPAFTTDALLLIALPHPPGAFHRDPLEEVISLETRHGLTPDEAHALESALHSSSSPNVCILATRDMPPVLAEVLTPLDAERATTALRP